MTKSRTRTTRTLPQRLSQEDLEIARQLYEIEAMLDSGRDLERALDALELVEERIGRSQPAGAATLDGGHQAPRRRIHSTRKGAGA